MAKKAKYEMRVITIHLDTAPINISKKEFEWQIKHYKDVIARNHEEYKDEITECDQDGRDYCNIEGYVDDLSIRVDEYEQYTVTRYSVHSSELGISFYKYEAKPGYCWK